jgi:hypothetical protein
MVGVLGVSLDLLICRVGIGSELALLRLEDFERVDWNFILSRTLSTQFRTEEFLTSSILVTHIGHIYECCECSKSVGAGLTRNGPLAAFRRLLIEYAHSIERGKQANVAVDIIKE